MTRLWSNYSLDDYREILAGIGFRLLETAVVGHGYTEAYQKGDERHPLIFAQKERFPS